MIDYDEGRNLPKKRRSLSRRGGREMSMTSTGGRCMTCLTTLTPLLLFGFGFGNNAFNTLVAVSLAKFIYHRFRHEADPSKAFSTDTLVGPVQFAFFVFKIWLEFFARK